MPSDRTGRALLLRLLSERNHDPSRAAAIDAEIRRAFERRVAVLALDMCGFSRTTAAHGIIHYLAMIQQMEEAAGPAVAGNHGRVIKHEADNLWAIFDNPGNALEAALDIFRSFEAMNAVVPDERFIHGSIGIGYGDLLIVGEEDLFGHEMNVASKLGEDLAQQAEILLTPAAHAALPSGRYAFTPLQFTLSRFHIHCHRYDRTLQPTPERKE